MERNQRSNNKPDSLTTLIALRLIENDSASASTEETRQRLMADIKSAEQILMYLSGRYGYNHPEIVGARQMLDQHRNMVRDLPVITNLESLAITDPNGCVASDEREQVIEYPINEN